MTWKASGRFVFRYTLEGEYAISSADNNQNGVPDYIDDLYGRFNFSWQQEIGEYKYKEISGGYLPLQVYLYNTGGSVKTEFLINVVRIHLDNDIPIQLRGVFVAHEFFHAVQFTGYDPGEAEWWIEGTAVWMEDEVYDDVNNYVGYIHHFTDCPEWSLDNSNSDHEYGAVIFPKLISERRGVGQIRVIWQGCGVQTG
ncbi:MAG: hypothetical protein ABIL39_00585 [candidate division WOR-3 bacterium]